MDTIIGGKHQGALASMVDRASTFPFLALVSSKAAIGVRRAMLACSNPVKDRVLTITADNGKEFAHHQQIARALSASFYFARPYHSWERGLNEHTNGLVRQYFPKATNFRTVEPAAVMRVQTILNDRPRKCLGYRTPAEVFIGARYAVAAAVDGAPRSEPDPTAEVGAPGSAIPSSPVCGNGLIRSYHQDDR